MQTFGIDLETNEKIINRNRLIIVINKTKQIMTHQ